MSLLGLGSDIFNNGLGQGISNYVGNSTNLGRDINMVGNDWQTANNQPQSQLIGTAPTQNTLQTPTAPNRSDVLDKYLKNQKAGIVGKLIGTMI